jgi:hypothetical protein
VYEQELALLVDTMSKERSNKGYFYRRSACAERARYIGEKLVKAEETVERLEQMNKEWKKTLSS